MARSLNTAPPRFPHPCFPCQQDYTLVGYDVEVGATLRHAVLCCVVTEAV